MQVAVAAKDAVLPMMIPAILLGGILTGWFTPTEAGVVAVAWILLVVIGRLLPLAGRHGIYLPIATASN
jgi:C4-dicarboxylate transporter, DctM subunit